MVSTLYIQNNELVEQPDVSDMCLADETFYTFIVVMNTKEDLGLFNAQDLKSEHFQKIFGSRYISYGEIS